MGQNQNKRTHSSISWPFGGVIGARPSPGDSLEGAVIDVRLAWRRRLPPARRLNAARHEVYVLWEGRVLELESTRWAVQALLAADTGLDLPVLSARHARRPYEIRWELSQVDARRRWRHRGLPGGYAAGVFSGCFVETQLGPLPPPGRAEVPYGRKRGSPFHRVGWMCRKTKILRDCVVRQNLWICFLRF